MVYHTHSVNRGLQTAIGFSTAMGLLLLCCASCYCFVRVKKDDKRASKYNSQVVPVAGETDHDPGTEFDIGNFQSGTNEWSGNGGKRLTVGNEKQLGVMPLPFPLLRPVTPAGNAESIVEDTMLALRSHRLKTPVGRLSAFEPDHPQSPVGMPLAPQSNEHKTMLNHCVLVVPWLANTAGTRYAIESTLDERVPCCRVTARASYTTKQVRNLGLVDQQFSRLATFAKAARFASLSLSLREEVLFEKLFGESLQDAATDGRVIGAYPFLQGKPFRDLRSYELAMKGTNNVNHYRLAKGLHVATVIEESQPRITPRNARDSALFTSSTSALAVADGEKAQSSLPDSTDHVQPFTDDEQEVCLVSPVEAVDSQLISATVSAPRSRPLYVLNWFYPLLYESYCGSTTSESAKSGGVLALVVEWDGMKMKWKHFLEEIIGLNDPSVSSPTSLRGNFFSDWQRLGLTSQPNLLYNAMHVSASAFEAMNERLVWFSATDLRADVLGSVLLTAFGEDTDAAEKGDTRSNRNHHHHQDLPHKTILSGMSSRKLSLLLKRWLSNPVVEIGVDVITDSFPVFEYFNRCDSNECIQKMGLLLQQQHQYRPPGSKDSNTNAIAARLGAPLLHLNDSIYSLPSVIKPGVHGKCFKYFCQCVSVNKPVV
jgi:hypothetical protein